MIASVKLELWYLNTPEMTVLIDDEGPLVAQGVMLSLLTYLRLCHNAVGHRRMLKKLARNCCCDADWLWHIVTDYGLFTVAADETFYSPYLMKTLGIGQKERSSRKRTRYNARYNEDNKDNHDNDDNKDKENRKKTPAACVCLQGTQETADNGAAPSPPPPYLGYDRRVDGRRYGYRGEPVPDDAPEQVSQDTRWSWTTGRWVPRAQWHVKREKKAYERITQQRWQTMENGRS